MKSIVFGTLIVTVTAGAAQAGTPWIKHRQQHQLTRIGNGITSARLTAGEAARLLNGQVYIANLRAAAKANDGVVGPGERLLIHGAQTWQSLRIYHLKHN